MFNEMSPELIAAWASTGFIGLFTLINWWRLNRRIRHSKSNAKELESRNCGLITERDRLQKDCTYYRELYHKETNLKYEEQRKKNEQEQIARKKEEDEKAEKQRHEMYHLWNIEFKYVPMSALVGKYEMVAQHRQTGLDCNFEQTFSLTSEQANKNQILAFKQQMLDRLVQHTNILKSM